jgi:hypothetical protein
MSTRSQTAPLVIDREEGKHRREVLNLIALSAHRQRHNPAALWGSVAGVDVSDVCHTGPCPLQGGRRKRWLSKVKKALEKSSAPVCDVTRSQFSPP